MYMIKRIKTQIKSNDDFKEYCSNLIKNNNKLLYKEDDTKVALTILDEEVILERKNKEMEAKFTFNKNSNSCLLYTLLKENLTFKTNFDTKDIKILDNEILISYKIDNNSFLYSLNYKEDL